IDRLVQLYQIEYPGFDASAHEQLPHLWNRPNAHNAWVDARGRRAGEPAERLDSELARLLLRGDDDGGRSVVDPARVAGGDGALLPERRAKLRELLGVRVRPRMLVALSAVERDGLVGGATGELGLRPALLRAKGERILLLER